MVKRLAIIVGAGASYDCVSSGITDFDTNWRPPLTKELFAFRSTFNEVLARYPRAQALSDEIRTKVNAGTSLEALLNLYESETNLTLRKQYRQIPLYLQELLGTVSENFVRTGSTRFETLFRAVLKSSAERVMFLSLNYDLLLERAITNVTGHLFNDLYSYRPQGEKWSLIKLHGSVNWGWELLSPSVEFTSSLRILDSLDREPVFSAAITVLPGFRENQRVAGGKFFYPAMAVPLEGKKNSVCDPQHLTEAKAFLPDCTSLLVLGFSALDEDVLQLLQGMRKVDNLKVVCESQNSALETIERLYKANPACVPGWQHPVDNHVYSEGFASFVGKDFHLSFLNS